MVIVIELKENSVHFTFIQEHILNESNLITLEMLLDM